MLEGIDDAPPGAAERVFTRRAKELAPTKEGEQFLPAVKERFSRIEEVSLRLTRQRTDRALKISTQHIGQEEAFRTQRAGQRFIFRYKRLNRGRECTHSREASQPGGRSRTSRRKTDRSTAVLPASAFPRWFGPISQV
ncbi:hypothetical protein P3T21_007115 [Paraburkholderia sp. GAS334]